MSDGFKHPGRSCRDCHAAWKSRHLARPVLGMSAQIVLHGQFGSTLEAILQKQQMCGLVAFPPSGGGLTNTITVLNQKGRITFHSFPCLQLSEAKRLHRQNYAVVCLRRKKKRLHKDDISLCVCLSVCLYLDARWQVPIHPNSSAMRFTSWPSSNVTTRPPAQPRTATGPPICSFSFCLAAKRKSENRYPTHRASRRGLSFGENQVLLRNCWACWACWASLLPLLLRGCEDMGQTKLWISASSLWQFEPSLLCVWPPKRLWTTQSLICLHNLKLDMIDMLI